MEGGKQKRNRLEFGFEFGTFETSPCVTASANSITCMVREYIPRARPTSGAHRFQVSVPPTITRGRILPISTACAGALCIREKALRVMVDVMAIDHGGLANGDVLEDRQAAAKELNGGLENHKNGKQLSASAKRKERKKRQRDAKLAERQARGSLLPRLFSILQQKHFH